MNLKNISTKELENELDKRRRIDKLSKVPMPLENIDWKPLVELCEQIKQELVDDPFSQTDSDNSHYIYETVFEVVYGKDRFNNWQNSLLA